LETITPIDCEIYGTTHDVIENKGRFFETHDVVEKEAG
jgi:hypothetical protein